MGELDELFKSAAGTHRTPPASTSTFTSSVGSYRLNKIKLDLAEAVKRLNAKIGKRDLLLEQRDDAIKRKAAAQSQLEVFDLVQILLQKTSDYARQQTKGRIEELVSQALTVVYGTDHRFIIDIVTRAGRPEVDYYLHDGTTLVQLKKPVYDTGGGKINIVTIALRLGIDEIVGDTAPLFLDEIGANVDGEAAVNLAYFIKQYAAQFNRQIILITHNEALADAADYGIRVEKRNGAAVVKGGGDL